MTLNHLKNPSLETVRRTVLAFRERIEANSSGFLLAPTPVCPKTQVCPTTRAEQGFVQSYTFSVQDLLSKMDDSVVVHHGALPREMAAELHFLYDASPIIYAHRTLGKVSLSLQQIKQVIEGRIADWETLGYRSGPIQFFCHSGVVQKSVFEIVSTHIFGVQQINNNLTSCGTYEGLATQAGKQAGSIVFGLRPEFAPSELRPVSIADCWPGTPMNGKEYPSLPVWISLPRNVSAGGLKEYLDLVTRRMESDVLALQKPGESHMANLALQPRHAAVFIRPAIRNHPNCR